MLLRTTLGQLVRHRTPIVLPSPPTLFTENILLSATAHTQEIGGKFAVAWRSTRTTATVPYRSTRTISTPNKSPQFSRLPVALDLPPQVASSAAGGARVLRKPSRGTALQVRATRPCVRTRQIGAGGRNQPFLGAAPIRGECRTMPFGLFADPFQMN